MRRSLLLVLLLGLGLVGCGDDANQGPDMDAGVDAPPMEGETLCTQLPPVSSGTCEVTPGTDERLILGNILTPQTVFVGGQVVVNAEGQITCVGCDCAKGGETKITCPG